MRCSSVVVVWYRYSTRHIHELGYYIILVTTVTCLTSCLVETVYRYVPVVAAAKRYQLFSISFSRLSSQALRQCYSAAVTGGRYGSRRGDGISSSTRGDGAHTAVRVRMTPIGCPSSVCCPVCARMAVGLFELIELIARRKGAPSAERAYRDQA